MNDLSKYSKDGVLTNDVELVYNVMVDGKFKTTCPSNKLREVIAAYAEIGTVSIETEIRVRNQS
jgi:hypothetical protein